MLLSTQIQCLPRVNVYMLLLVLNQEDALHIEYGLLDDTRRDDTRRYDTRRDETQMMIRVTKVSQASNGKGKLLMKNLTLSLTPLSCQIF